MDIVDNVDKQNDFWERTTAEELKLLVYIRARSKLR